VRAAERHKKGRGSVQRHLQRHCIPVRMPSLAMGNASRFDAPVWGDQKSGYAVYVSAKSGAVVK